MNFDFELLNFMLEQSFRPSCSSFGRKSGPPSQKEGKLRDKPRTPAEIEALPCMHFLCTPSQCECAPNSKHLHSVEIQQCFVCCFAPASSKVSSGSTVSNRCSKVRQADHAIAVNDCRAAVNVWTELLLHVLRQYEASCHTYIKRQNL